MHGRVPETAWGPATVGIRSARHICWIRRRSDSRAYAGHRVRIYAGSAVHAASRRKLRHTQPSEGWDSESCPCWSTCAQNTASGGSSGKEGAGIRVTTTTLSVVGREGGLVGGEDQGRTSSIRGASRSSPSCVQSSFPDRFGPQSSFPYTSWIRPNLIPSNAFRSLNRLARPLRIPY